MLICFLSVYLKKAGVTLNSSFKIKNEKKKKPLRMSQTSTLVLCSRKTKLVQDPCMSQLMRLWYLLHRRPASAQSRQNLCYSHTWSMEIDEGSNQKSDI